MSRIARASTRSSSLRPWRVGAASLICALGATQGCADDAKEVPIGYQIQVAPLTLPGLTDACYGLRVYNSETTFDASTTVWSLDNVCATQYGNNQASITYVGTCDASFPNNTVELILEGLWTGGAHDDEDANQLDEDGDFVNPCTSADAAHTCRLVRPCLENEDTLVEFNLTIMRSAIQGFFDIAVNFEDIFCSAKADCEYADGDPIELLFNGQERDSTAVLAFACTGGENANTSLYLSDTFIVCDDTTNTTNMTTTPGTHVVARLRPSYGPGNVASPIPDQGLFGYGVYRGKEQLGAYHKAYSNMAIGLDDTFFHGCPAGYMHQDGRCLTCPQVVPSGRYTFRNAIGDQCGYCPAGSQYVRGGKCLACPAGQTLLEEIEMCGGEDLPWTPATVVAPDPLDLIPATGVALDPNNPRLCYAYMWATAADELWPELQTPDATTYPVVRYMIPLNPPEDADENATSTLSCGTNPINGSEEDENGTSTQYTAVDRPACFENHVGANWSNPASDVTSTHYAQFSHRTEALLTQLNPTIPPCEFDWDMPFAKGGAPVNHAAVAQTVNVYTFDDLDGDGVMDGGEPLVGGFDFLMMPQTLSPFTALIVGGSSPQSAATTGAGPASFTNVQPGNYLITVVGKPSSGCTNFTYTSPQDVTMGTQVPNNDPTSWNPSGNFSTHFTVGAPTPLTNLLVGVDCQ